MSDAAPAVYFTQTGLDTWRAFVTLVDEATGARETIVVARIRELEDGALYSISYAAMRGQCFAGAGRSKGWRTVTHRGDLDGAQAKITKRGWIR